MKILITGGAGFIGSHVSDVLAENNDVVIIDNLVSGKRDNIQSHQNFYQADIKDRARIDTIFKKEAPEAIVHLAAQKSVTKSVADPVHDAHENVIGSLTLFEVAKKHGVKKIVFSSTGGALYGDTDHLPTPESHSTLAESPYGIAKKVVEDYLRFYAATHQFEPAILRFSNVYGPRQDAGGEGGVVAIFCTRFLENQPLTIFGDGEQTRDYVYVKDVALAIKKALAIPKAITVNIASASEITVNDLVKQLQRITGHAVDIEYLPARSGEVRRSCLDITQANKLLRWKPRTTLSEGLENTLEWAKLLQSV